MIIKLRSLIAALDPNLKPWMQIGCGRTLLYRALTGCRVDRQSALPFIATAREQLGSHVTGVEIGGEVHYAPEVIDSFQSRIAELEAENARLRADNVTLSRIAYRRILVGAVSTHN